MTGEQGGCFTPHLPIYPSAHIWPISAAPPSCERWRATAFPHLPLLPAPPSFPRRQRFAPPTPSHPAVALAAGCGERALLVTPRAGGRGKRKRARLRLADESSATQVSTCARPTPAATHTPTLPHTQPPHAPSYPPPHRSFACGGLPPHQCASRRLSAPFRQGDGMTG